MERGPAISGAAQSRGRRRTAKAITIVAALGVLASACGSSGPDARSERLAGAIRSDRWQAVFLTNDHVYFGHLRQLGGDWLELRDAHFIRTNAAGGKGAGSQQVVSIGDELQQPEPKLVLNARQVVSVENLRDDSR